MDTFKVEAAYSVLSRLGDSMFEILKEGLAEYHHITLNAGSRFSMDELEAALRDLVGGGAAKWLMLEIAAEIDFLAREHFAKARNVVLTEQKN
jgi:hypothetical protein